MSLLLDPESCHCNHTTAFRPWNQQELIPKLGLKIWNDVSGDRSIDSATVVNNNGSPQPKMLYQTTGLFLNGRWFSASMLRPRLLCVAVEGLMRQTKHSVGNLLIKSWNKRKCPTNSWSYVQVGSPTFRMWCKCQVKLMWSTKKQPKMRTSAQQLKHIYRMW